MSLRLLPLIWLLGAAAAAAQTPDPPTVLWEDSPLSAYYHHGHAVAWLGDVDGDDADDFALSSVGRGEVHVFSGATQTEIANLIGQVRHGYALINTGDLDGDGVADFAASTPFANGSVGEVVVYSGASRTTLYTISGGQSGDYLGWGMAPVGDTDFDGAPDLLIRLERDQGIVRVYSGASGSLRYEIPAQAPFESMGKGIAGIHDSNGDGAADFLLGAPERGFGEVVLHSGADGSVLDTLTESGTFEYGDAICQLGDLNGDQIPDFAVGAPDARLGLLRVGEVFVYSGADRSRLHRLSGTQQNERFGDLLADGGDYNRDGVGDLLIAAPGADGAGLTRPGRVDLISGADQSVLGTVFGKRSFESMPSSLAGHGDAHFDLHPDYLIGNWQAGSAEQGRVQLWGAPSPELTVDTLLAGQTAKLRVTGCQGGSTVTFYASLQGNGPTPTALGLALLSPPFRLLGSATAQATGLAERTELVPLGALHRSIDFQAIEFRPGGGTRLTTGTHRVVQ